MRRLLANFTKASSQQQGLHAKAECKAATDVLMSSRLGMMVSLLAR